MNQIINELLNLADEEYRKFQKKLCPDTNKKIIGIRIPILKNLAKNIVKEGIGEEFLKNVKDEYYEEIVLQGLVIGYSKISIERKLEVIKKFVPKIDSWGICDSFVPSLKIKKESLDIIWDFILPYSQSKKEFEVRFAVIMMLDYYITEEYVDRVINILDNINNNGYYAKMAIAWTMAEIGIKFNTKAMEYLKKSNLDKFTYNKTLQKLIESYRITDEQKIILKGMKRI